MKDDALKDLVKLMKDEEFIYYPTRKTRHCPTCDASESYALGRHFPGCDRDRLLRFWELELSKEDQNAAEKTGRSGTEEAAENYDSDQFSFAFFQKTADEFVDEVRSEETEEVQEKAMSLESITDAISRIGIAMQSINDYMCSIDRYVVTLNRRLSIQSELIQKGMDEISVIRNRME